jgi:hypothetical protein
MSGTKMTAVSVNGHGVYLARGHVDTAEAVRRCKAAFEPQARQAAEVLAAIETGGTTVYHQVGIYRVTSRKPAPQ